MRKLVGIHETHAPGRAWPCAGGESAVEDGVAGSCARGRSAVEDDADSCAEGCIVGNSNCGGQYKSHLSKGCVWTGPPYRCQAQYKQHITVLSLFSLFPLPCKRRPRPVSSLFPFSPLSLSLGSYGKCFLPSDFFPVRLSGPYCM